MAKVWLLCKGSFQFVRSLTEAGGNVDALAVFGFAFLLNVMAPFQVRLEGFLLHVLHSGKCALHLEDSKQIVSKCYGDNLND